MIDPETPKPGPGPVMVAAGGSPAAASTPDRLTEDGYHLYDTNPVPWWVVVIWLGFFAFAFVYLVTNLLAQ